jgi:hypothetical protein
MAREKENLKHEDMDRNTYVTPGRVYYLSLDDVMWCDVMCVAY